MISLAVLVIVVLFAINGMKKGLIKQLSPILSVLAAAVLVHFLLPVVTQTVKERTPVYEYAAQWSRSAVTAQTEKYLTGEGILQGQGDAASLTKIQQTGLIRSLPVPDFVGKMIESYNNSEGYRRLGVTTFIDYLAGCIASLAINAVSFLAVMFITFILIRLVIGSLHLFSRLPIVGPVNRLGGLLAGALRGVFFVWILMLVVSVFSGTPAGAAVMDQIDKSYAIWPVYQSNIFLRIITDAVSKII